MKNSTEYIQIEEKWYHTSKDCKLENILYEGIKFTPRILAVPDDIKPLHPIAAQDYVDGIKFDDVIGMQKLTEPTGKIFNLKGDK